MNTELLEIIRQHCHPLEPKPTREVSSLGPLSDIRAVLFDIYGTLFISASGDIGLADDTIRGDAATEALEAVGLKLHVDGSVVVERLHETIREDHAAARERGIEFPEVDIREIWQTTLTGLRESGQIEGDPKVDLERLSVEYEVRTNPVWPMPGLLDCLQACRTEGMVLGIISNAQFFTPALFDSLVGSSLDDLGFDAELRYYSYEHRHAKPGTVLYKEAAQILKSRGISATQTLYLGNDMRNDIYPAQKVGFQTALFAGDARSLRLRQEDPQISSIQPDLKILSLSDLPDCLDTPPSTRSMK